ncbi:MAG: hypothetical protein ACYTGQ_10255, partial [Planctomycetota bacterium]
MIEHVLRERLEAVAESERRFRLRRGLGACWIVGVLLAGAMLCASWAGWWSGGVVAAVGIGVCLLAAAVWGLGRESHIDYGEVAQKIEAEYPDLRALLLTAAEQKPRNEDGTFGYLQERVIGEAVTHAHRHGWVRAVSDRSLRTAWLINWAGLAAFVMIMSQLTPSMSFIGSIDRAVRMSRGLEVVVSPGDTELEAGSGMVVVARFEGGVPAEASVVIRERGADGEPIGSSRRVPLRKNLEDPVFGGSIGSVNANLLYWVEYPGGKSSQHTVTVFEHPELLGADAKITPPDYTEMDEKTIKDTRRVSVIEGSEVAWSFHLNKAVVGAWLVGDNEQA